ncbi:MAG: porin [Gammaproteobacteria bacterium]|nr:porin [Gammaproteobacteria bacterium]MBU1733198.1 porin [Gammaproteobacteria bacterium]MBU1892246.1 porin [Gammaproteobacteria bacterium]
MNKKLLALAVAAALIPAAAMADSGNVKISGGLHMSVDSLDDGMNRETNIASNSSWIKFSGDEALGNGLKAIWQLDTQIGMGNTSNDGNNTWANRNSFIGLSGNFGTTILGRHDTPLKLVGRKADLFGDQIGDSRNLITVGGIGDLRPDNVIAYISPTMGGFHGAIAYVTNNDANFTEANSTKATSALGIYENGPVMLGLGYEVHNVAGTSADPKQWRLVGGYNFGDVKLVALYQKADDLGAVDSADRKVWGLGAAYKMGAATIKGQYYNAGDLNSVNNTGAKMYALGVDYSLSKRTTTYVAYARTNNDDNTQSFTAFGGGHGDNPATAAAGENSTGFSLGMKHSF